MQISKDKLTVTQIDHAPPNQFAFCKEWIDSCLPQIVKWKLKTKI